MHRLSRALLIATAVVALSLCLLAQSPDQALAQQIADEVAAVSPGITPAAWIAAHSGEKIATYNGRQLANDTEKWCARAVERHAPATGSGEWTRTVYFYDPPAPADDALPAPSTPPSELVSNGCRLGLLWIDLPETDPAAGVRLVQAIAAALAARYGPAQHPRIPGGFGSAGWTEVSQWRAGDGIITAGYDKFGGVGHRVLVRLVFPNSDAPQDFTSGDEQGRAEVNARRDAALHAIDQAQMPAAVTRALASLLKTPDFYEAKNLPSGAQVVAAMRAWLSAAQSRPAGQHAIALLAADDALAFLTQHGVAIGDAARGQLASLGADFVPDQLAGGDVYAHGLLSRAKQIAPPGPATDAVVLAEMRLGFDWTGMCSAGEEEYSQVIQAGESLLAQARSLPAATLADAHFMVADAYATVVWLATGDDTTYHDPKKFQAAASAARAKALEHYRSALVLEHGTPRSHAAWDSAWRLAAGLPPTTERYFCIYD